MMQRTRCPYFYDTNQPCNKRVPGSGCGAIGGFSRQHAIVGVSDACIATHPSDMAVAMRVLDATVETIRSDGSTRTIPIAEFHRLPGDQPHIDTVLMAGEPVQIFVAVGPTTTSSTTTTSTTTTTIPPTTTSTTRAPTTTLAQPTTTRPPA